MPACIGEIFINYSTVKGDYMIPVILIVKEPGKKNWEGKGTHEFIAMPRVGEYITMDVGGIGYAYRVVAIHHPDIPTVTAGDVYAVQEGIIHEMLTKLFDDI